MLNEAYKMSDAYFLAVRVRISDEVFQFSKVHPEYIKHETQLQMSRQIAQHVMDNHKLVTMPVPHDYAHQMQMGVYVLVPEQMQSLIDRVYDTAFKAGAKSAKN